MRSQDMATVGLRLLGVAAMAIACFLLILAVSTRLWFALPHGGGKMSAIGLDDSYYVVNQLQYDTMAVGIVAAAIGALLLVSSRPLSRCMTKGME